MVRNVTFNQTGMPAHKRAKQIKWEQNNIEIRIAAALDTNYSSDLIKA
jgi:hypothetical protein